MPISPLAGKPAPHDLLIDPARLERDYYEKRPNLDDPNQLVSFGTSGHRGTPFDGTFTEAHILAITQAICEYRTAQDITGPVFVGKDTHAASAPAQRTALEVLAANGVDRAHPAQRRLHPHAGHLPRHPRPQRRSNSQGLADGIVITPSHNPPADGGFKYNPPNGGPADTDVTSWIQNRANELLRGGNCRRETSSPPIATDQDYITPYVDDLAQRNRHGRHPRHRPPHRHRSARRRVRRTTGNPSPNATTSTSPWSTRIIDPTFSFMTVDHDGKIRMDCSSPYAMASLVKLKDQFDIAFGNDPDADRHGIVTRSSGLMNPNYYLAVAIQYLISNRPEWPAAAVVGKTLVCSGMIDRVVADLGRTLYEVPVGFKWFAPGLFDGTCCFGGEESAGASFLRRNGKVWSTDKDGLILGLLSAEITAKTGRDPGEHFQDITDRIRPIVLHPHRRPRHARTESQAEKPHPRSRDSHRTSRRSHHRQTNQGPRQRRPDRRSESSHDQRLVRRPPLRHRKHLQDLRGKLPKRGTPQRNRDQAQELIA